MIHAYRKIQTGQDDDGDWRRERKACSWYYSGWGYCQAGFETKPLGQDGRRALGRPHGGHVRYRFEAAGQLSLKRSNGNTPPTRKALVVGESRRRYTRRGMLKNSTSLPPIDPS